MERNNCTKEEAILKRLSITEKWVKSMPRLKYSMVSQELFWKIYNIIKEDYKEIYFATINSEGNLIEGCNYEYEVKTEKSIRYLDFYIKDINKVIEFNGAYWHSIANKNVNYTIDKDIERELEIIKVLNCKVYNVKELEFYKDKESVINACIDFIHNG